MSANAWDPTRPSGFVSRAAVPATSHQRLRLESTLMGVHRNLAVISGRSYSLGDTTPLGRITEIRPGTVTIVGERQHVLRLPAKSIRHRHVESQ